MLVLIYIETCLICNEYCRHGFELHITKQYKKWPNGNENQCQITLENKLQMWYFANDNTTEFLRKY